MKKFKELGLAFIAIIACISMTACNSEIDAPASDEEPDVYTVQLGWGGELDVTYEPLSRANTDDLYGIQVYSTLDKELEEGEEVVWTNYAYGLFDDTNDISINLLKGYKYKFVATMIKEGMNKFDLYHGCNGFTGLGDPFFGTGGPTAFEDKFNYDSNWSLSGLGNGYSYLLDGKFYTHPNTERFYGELGNYIPNKNSNKAKIHMTRTSFGAKFIAKGKAADAIGSKLEIQIAGAPKMELTIEKDNKQISDIFTFSNVYNAWTATDHYTETIAVTINWHRIDGTIVPLGTHDITYKRNATTVVQVSVVNDTSSEDVGIEVETTAIEGNSEYDTEIEDGVIVDTKVDTNK